MNLVYDYWSLAIAGSRNRDSTLNDSVFLCWVILPQIIQFMFRDPSLDNPVFCLETLPQIILFMFRDPSLDVKSRYQMPRLQLIRGWNIKTSIYKTILKLLPHCRSLDSWQFGSVRRQLFADQYQVVILSGIQSNL